MDQHFSIRVSRRSVRLALALAVVLAVLAPVAVFAVGGTFTDDDTSIFETNIEWMATNGITSGCGEGLYCPDDNVTRGQMAAFMQRLAQKKVVNAATAVEADHAAAADTAGEAENSDTVDGFDANQLMRVAYAVSTNSAFLGDGLADGTILTTSITAPIDGFLVINASTDVFASGVDDRPGCSIELDGDEVSSAQREIMLNAATAVNVEEDCATNTVVPVEAGDYTVDFVTKFTPAVGITYDEAALSVLFVPFDGQGNPPTDFTVASVPALDEANS